MQDKPSLGKYRFNKPTDITVTTQFNNVGMPLKSTSAHFNSGDVIDVQKVLYNDKGAGWEAIIDNGNPVLQNRTVPFSILTKVPDSTLVTINVDKTKVDKILSGKDANNATQPIKPSLPNESLTPILNIAPLVLAGVGALIAHNKKLGVIGFILCISGGYVLGKGTKNMVLYNNLIGWH